jgi:hypothetical protein
MNRYRASRVKRGARGVSGRNTAPVGTPSQLRSMEWDSHTPTDGLAITRPAYLEHWRRVVIFTPAATLALVLASIDDPAAASAKVPSPAKRSAERKKLLRAVKENPAAAEMLVGNVP